MDAKSRNLLEIHFAVFLFGLAGLFGKVVELSALMIVFGRVFFASIFLGGVLLYRKQKIKLDQYKDYVYMLLMGCLLATHWVTFFQSIQMSTVAIGLLTFSTFPVFVTFLEPYFFKEKIKPADMAVAGIAFLGIMLVVPRFELDNHITKGALWGIVSGFTYALLSMLNRRYAKDYSGIVVAFYEQLISVIVLLPFFLVQQPVVKINDLLLLFVLGIIFTGIAHSLFINGLQNIKTQTAGIISCLEPVYGIIFAAFLLHELPTAREMMGGSIILGTVLYSTIKSKK
ncbi:DMT family transporter [Sporomusa acidovorans]|uniref:Inner membrane transporter YicL n=1 Tax=Sporomusa acidovorans (strain ATCC 49682 / DSM 3132 / Mol) TaxID=1123286 RepID=A0ABZ3IZS5_SPOA4|nr:DMT family transporter [Sporomusa acidovorans]OZC18320.1 putative inner membrane transporter YicL [Sporomusa acidovorans DSM 3132]SDF20061.1 Threonine/homoserine efflux transporter RhtA [Sporomusa acidovorans]